MFERYEDDASEGVANRSDFEAVQTGASTFLGLGMSGGGLGRAAEMLESLRMSDAWGSPGWSPNIVIMREGAPARVYVENTAFSSQSALSLSELEHAPSGAPLVMRPAKGGETDTDSGFTFSCGCGCGSSRGGQDAQGGGGASIANPGDAYGQGVTALIGQTFNAPLNRYEFTGNQNIDAVLIGSKWTAATLTFAFPTSGAAYANEGYGVGTEPDFHVPFNAAQVEAVRYALGLVSAYTNLNFTEVSGDATASANLRFSQTSYDEVPSAYANFPSSQLQSGDVWFGMTGQPFYDNPQIGNWGMATQLHEIGHALGLKHGHQDYTNIDLAGEGYLDHPSGTDPRYGSKALTADRDGQAWSLMSYNAAPGEGGDFYGEGFNQPQTYMMYDIAALQHLYGADFTTNGGDTVYAWNATTGVMSINGVAQGAPSSNKVFMTLWDGNGIDTFDLSNYADGVNVNLNPGEFSTLSTAQLVDHNAANGGGFLAPGNVANALLFNGDVRSLIENAIGGVGNDQMIGNQASNTLTGNGGVDTLIGSVGHDFLYGGEGDDFLYGDAKAATPSGVGFGSGQVTKGAGAGNSTWQTAMDVGNAFSLAADADIENATTVPHVSIMGTGDGNKDYYKLSVVAGSVLTFDIDYTTGGMDSFIRLLDAGGNVLAYDDDSATSDGAGGSTSGLDSLIRFTATYTGTYIIEVGVYDTSTSNDPIDAGDTYELQISAAGTAALGGGSGNDRLFGGAGADVMVGGLGNDIYYVDRTADQVIELAGEGVDTVRTTSSYALAANIEVGVNDTAVGRTLIGNELDNTLKGNNGNDTLNGGTGIDRLEGGRGDDLYIVDRVGDVVVELADQGIDTVRATSHYSLSANVENGIVNTTSGRNLTGNELANTLTGNIGNDVLDGGAGADILRGGAGDDTYVVNTTSDQIIENANQGVDTIRALSSYTLSANVENGVIIAAVGRTMNGNALNNVLTGGIGDDVLNGNEGFDVMDGGAGADTMRGGLGDDTFIVDRTTDKVIELAEQGIDMVLTTSNYTLSANVEHGNIIGSTGRTLTGNDLINRLVGGEGDDTLNGEFGADILNGGAGIDTLVGGAGDDSYYVDRVGEILVELAGEGIDTVYISSHYTMAANLEIGIVEVSQGRNLTGNASNNTLIGNAGTDVLTGGLGADVMTGNGGADRFDFNAVTESTWAAYDTITDLTDSDIIDLSTIDANSSLAGNQAFVLVNAFTGVAGQLRLIYSAASGDTYVAGDINGDGVGDFRIRLVGDHRDYDNFVL